jgi:hypothetical protein
MARKILSWLLFLVGSWMLISPQALTGLSQLKWMYASSFPGEILVGIVVLVIAYYLFNFSEPEEVRIRKH